MTSDDSQDPNVTSVAASANATEQPLPAAEPAAEAPVIPEVKVGEAQQSGVGRKLVPPPKPFRDSRPSVPPEDSSAPSSSLTPSRPMIVLGEPSQKLPREGAQAWNRPPSEPPRPGDLSWGTNSGKREPTASVGALRSRLEAREKTSPPRQASSPPQEPAAPQTAPQVIATPVPARITSSPDLPSPTPRDSGKIDSAPRPAPEVVPSLPNVEFSSLSAEFVAPPLPAALAPVAAPARRASLESQVEPEVAPLVSSEGQVLPPRPKSSPARRRSGPPRPRASSPGFGAVRPASTPPRPAAPGTGTRDADVLNVPPAPKVPHFSSGGSPATPDEERPARRSEPPVPASAIAVMKIIAVGDPSAEATVEIGEEFEETNETSARGVSSTLEAFAPMPVHPEDLEELPADEVSPDAAERKTPIPELSSDEAIPVEEDVEATTPAVPANREVDLRPPPPPRRTPKTPSLPKALPQAKRRQKRPWWEDVFGEDFVRAAYRLTDRQVQKEVDFIEESLGIAAGGVVLDLGCGSGNHAVELASRGYGVVGYDLSLYQLALAAEVAQERAQKLNFLQGDMREMAFEEMFDGIFCWNTSFGYFEEDKNLLVAERVFRALRPGGMFLLDVVNRDSVAAQSPGQLWYEGDSCVCMDDMSLDFITSRMRVKRSVILDDGRTRECVYSVRVYSLHELGKLLHDVGFRVIEASGHPAMPGVFFGEYSPRIIVLAQKP